MLPHYMEVPAMGDLHWYPHFEAQRIEGCIQVGALAACEAFFLRNGSHDFCSYLNKA